MQPVETVRMIGRGSIGIAFASCLMDRGLDFAFVVDPERKARYEAEGFVLNGRPVQLPYVTPEESSWADLILITTKRSGLEAAMELAEPLMKEDTILLSGINGIESEDVLRKRFGRGRVVRAIAQKMDARYDGTSVRFTTPGELVYGPEGPEDGENVRRLDAFFASIGFPGVHSEDIVKDAWSKLMLNCAINQICAVHHATYGSVVSDPQLLSLFIGAMKEVQQTAASQGIVLEDSLLDGWVEAVRALDPDSMPSMAQDVLARRKTEKALFSGTVVPLAEAAGVQVPILKDLWEHLEIIESQY